MSVTERVSRWVMYFGVLALGGAILASNPASVLVALVLIGQYVTYTAYNGYQGATA